MKTSIWIEDGMTQIVLTPETDWEKKVCKQFQDSKHSLEVMEGSFYMCQGGWIRQGVSEDRSLIIRLIEVP